MSKTFNAVFDSMMDEYAQAYFKHMSTNKLYKTNNHHLEQLKRELKNDMIAWFVRHVEKVADNKEKIKDELWET